MIINFLIQVVTLLDILILIINLIYNHVNRWAELRSILLCDTEHFFPSSAQPD